MYMYGIKHKTNSKLPKTCSSFRLLGTEGNLYIIKMILVIVLMVMVHYQIFTACFMFQVPYSLLIL